MRGDLRTRSKRATTKVLILVFLLAAVVLVPGTLAQGGFGLRSWTVDGGGGTHTGGDYRLAGTVGQHDAATWTGGGFTLAGGFWVGGAAGPGPEYQIFLPLVMRNP